jgi:hypothetical protein
LENLFLIGLFSVDFPSERHHCLRATTVTAEVVRHVAAARPDSQICIDTVGAVYANVVRERLILVSFYVYNLIENDECENGGFVVWILVKIDIIGKLI